MDALSDWSRSTLASGIASGATSLAVSTGDGAARFSQATPYWVTIWNQTDFASASLDPNRENVRVTSRSGDVLTISACTNAHNTAGKTYGIVAGVTADTLAELTPIILTTQFNRTSSTTLTDVTGFTRNLEAGRWYEFELLLRLGFGTAGTYKFSLTGTATATSYVHDVFDSNVSRPADYTTWIERATSIGSTYLSPWTDGLTDKAHVIVGGIILVNAAGTLKLQFAQQTSDSAASSILVGSKFSLQSRRV
jgi:hypothetical protein